MNVKPTRKWVTFNPFAILDRRTAMRILRKRHNLAMLTHKARVLELMHLQASYANMGLRNHLAERALEAVRKVGP